ncbi:hypothetical protein C6499_22590 [Candidatus Poribacteria bacterium]|nr:MAG: hypothetical protein C6499_22590 [Candidatus Poribacteria bacterium]
MDHVRLRTDQAIGLLKDVVIDVLKNAQESEYVDIPPKKCKPDPDGGHAYIEATYIGEEMGTYEKKRKKGKSPGRIHREILEKLEDEGRVESLRSKSGKQRIGWRLTESEYNR